MDALLLARWQFGITTVYHFIFVPLTLGLAPLVAILQTFYYRTGNQAYRPWLFGSKGRTLLLVTHRLDDLEAFDRVIVMDGGRVVGDGTCSAVARRGGALARLRDTGRRLRN